MSACPRRLRIVGSQRRLCCDAARAPALRLASAPPMLAVLRAVVPVAEACRRSGKQPTVPARRHVATRCVRPRLDQLRAQRPGRPPLRPDRTLFSPPPERWQTAPARQCSCQVRSARAAADVSQRHSASISPVSGPERTPPPAACPIPAQRSRGRSAKVLRLCCFQKCQPAAHVRSAGACHSPAGMGGHAGTRRAPLTSVANHASASHLDAAE